MVVSGWIVLWCSTSSSFTIVKPVDNKDIQLGIMWHDVPNRGGRITINVSERNQGDIGISSGWQGDNAGGDGGAGACASTRLRYAGSTTNG